MFLTALIIKKNNYEKAVLVMNFLKRISDFLSTRKKYWLLPIIILLLLFVLFSGLIILSKGTAVAPFIYTIF